MGNRSVFGSVMAPLDLRERSYPADPVHHHRDQDTQTYLVNLQTLSSFALARMLNDCAEGSATQRAIQKELRKRCEEHKDTKTPWLFPAPPRLRGGATQDKK
jgi:hypothetical protein